MYTQYIKKYLSIILVGYVFYPILFAQNMKRSTQESKNKNSAQNQVIDINTKKSLVKWTGHKGFDIKYLQYSHEGTIDIKKGKVTLKTDGTLNHLSIIMDMTTIKNTDLTNKKKNKQLVDHLKNDDFFDVKKHKEASFVSSSITRKSQTREKTVYNVNGDLTIKDIKKPIQFEIVVSQNKKNKTLTGKTSLSLDRTKWGIHYNSTKNDKGSLIKFIKEKVIRDEFELSISIETQENKTSPEKYLVKTSSKPQKTDPLSDKKTQIDTNKSMVKWTGHKGFDIKYLQYSHEGTVDIKKGHITRNPDGILRHISIIMDMTTIKNTDLTNKKKNKQLVDHLKNDDFFDVKEHKESRFISSNITKKSQTKEKTVYNVKGDLTIKDIKHSIQFELTVSQNKDNKSLIGKTSLSLDRTEWGIHYNSTKNNKGSLIKFIKEKVIRDEFELSISIETEDLN